MADRAKKISELTAHSNPPANNILAIVHQPGLANAETRKITLTNLFANVASLTSNAVTVKTQLTANSLFVGNTTVANLFTSSLGTFIGSANGFIQIAFQNQDSGNNSSTDIAMYSDAGTELTNFVDIGITSSSYNQNTIFKSHDGYVYCAGNRLLLGSTANSVAIFAGGQTDSDVHTEVFANGVVRIKYLSSGTLNFDVGDVPPTPTTSGIAGDIKIDASHIYVCVANNTWKRAALTTWS